MGFPYQLIMTNEEIKQSTLLELEWALVQRSFEFACRTAVLTGLKEVQIISLVRTLTAQGYEGDFEHLLEIGREIAERNSKNFPPKQQPNDSESGIIKS